MPSRAASDQSSQGHPERRRVVLLVDTSRSYGREIVRGVGRYQRERGDWAITYKPHGLGEPTPPWLREARPDGVLAGSAASVWHGRSGNWEYLLSICGA